jgi:hypothetical protein
MKIINVSDPIFDVPVFTENIPKHKAVVMVYMMKGCPHCDQLKPKWEQVKSIMENDNKFQDTMSADIDSGASSMLSMPPVMGFPTIRVLKGDSLHEYEGVREVDPLLSFLKKTITTPPRRRRSTQRNTKRRHTTQRKHSPPTTKRRSAQRTAQRTTQRRRSTKRKHSPPTTKRRSTKRTTKAKTI